jgi:shikimate dehydrogenase
MKSFGIIGSSLSHSFSPAYFKQKFLREHIFDAGYEAFELQEMDELPYLLRNHKDLCGLNVTYPFKEVIIPWLDVIHPVAQKIGAVNTIQIIRDNNELQLIGYNTDYLGFMKTLNPIVSDSLNKALILGTGGAAKAVAYVLDELKIPFLYVSRDENNSSISYAGLNEKILSEYPLIINTTPLGMFPDVLTCPPVPYHLISELNYLYDLIYNPAETQFMINGRKQGASIKNGLDMLQFQADYAWEIWSENH